MAMGFNISENDDGLLVDINTTPLIDVMLVLLIMLIITIPIQTHAVRLDMPQANQPQPPVPPPVVNLDVDFDGTIAWNGNAIADIATLDSYLRNAATQAPQPEIHLLPNPLVKYQYVAVVLAEAQRLGVTRIGIVGNERFMDAK
jgi:biopolymer transport protein ExbD